MTNLNKSLVDSHGYGPFYATGALAHIYDVVVGGCSTAGSVWVMLEQPGCFKLPALLTAGIQILSLPAWNKYTSCAWVPSLFLCWAQRLRNVVYRWSHLW